MNWWMMMMTLSTDSLTIQMWMLTVVSRGRQIDVGTCINNNNFTICDFQFLLNWSSLKLILRNFAEERFRTFIAIYIECIRERKLLANGFGNLPLELLLLVRGVARKSSIQTIYLCSKVGPYDNVHCATTGMRHSSVGYESRM